MFFHYVLVAILMLFSAPAFAEGAVFFPPELDYKMICRPGKTEKPAGGQSHNSVAAQYHDGAAKLRGADGEVDIPQGLKLLEQARKGGSVAAAVMLADYYREQGDAPKAKELYQYAASLGDVAAMVKLAADETDAEKAAPLLAAARQKIAVDIASGECESLRSVHVLVDYLRAQEEEDAAALAWLNAAAEMGNIWANMSLSDAYNIGDGVPRDKKKAAFFLKRAADNGSSEAMVQLAENLLNFQPATGNPAEAESLLMRAANKENLRAYHLLNRLYAGDYSPTLKDQAKQRMALAAAVKLPHVTAELLVALADIKRRSYQEEEENQAFTLYQKAAEKGHIKAIMWVAEMMRYGIGTAQDVVGSLKYNRLAASLGSAEAALRMVDVYRCGIGKKPQASLEQYWLQRAQDLGSEAALMAQLPMMDVSLQKEALLRFARKGSRRAMVQLAFLEQPVDENTGWLKRALQQGEKREDGLLAYARMLLASPQPDYPKALNLLQEAAEKSTAARRFLAEYFLTQNQAEEALTLVDSLPEDAGSYALQAKIYEAAGRKEAAMEAQKIAAKYGHVPTLIALTEQAVQVGGLSDAAGYVSMAVAASPCRVRHWAKLEKLVKQGALTPPSGKTWPDFRTRGLMLRDEEPSDRQARMAWLLEDGMTAEAQEMLKETAMNGNVMAMRRLGEFFLLEEKNALKARQWLEMAAEQGDTAAESLLQRAYESGFLNAPESK